MSLSKKETQLVSAKLRPNQLSQGWLIFAQTIGLVHLSLLDYGLLFMVSGLTSTYLRCSNQVADKVGSYLLKLLAWFTLSYLIMDYYGFGFNFDLS